MKQKIFFAYESFSRSKTSINIDAINTCKNELNQGNRYIITTWEDLKNNGRVMINAILEAIDQCDIFACDLTFQNFNVFFELGYAIAKSRKLFLLINPNIENAIDAHKKIDFLQTIGYSTFSNGLDIINALENVPLVPSLLTDLHIENIEATHNVFYIRSIGNTQVSIDTIAFLQRSEFSFVLDDPDEVNYRSFKWYIESVLSSNTIIVHITDDKQNDAKVSNAKASLVSGIGRGYGKLTAFLSPVSFIAPIDYADDVINYGNLNECITRLKIWTDKYVPKIEFLTDDEEKEYNLIKIGLGYDVAESERDILSNYFVETSAYSTAMKSHRAFFIGRKGTGKTAIYLMLNNHLQLDDNALVISLKPETSDLLNNVEVASLYESAAQKSSFFFSIWKFVIYSKALLAVEEKLHNKNLIYFEESSIEKQILNFIEPNRDVFQQHFLEIISSLSNNIQENRLERMYKQLILPMERLLKQYGVAKKYINIAILADNLDKSWDVKTDLSIQAEMILSLFEVTENIENEFGHNNELSIKVILFLRQDIFNYIKDNAKEPDKLTLNKHEIDWASFPDQLKHLIEKRFMFVLNLKSIDAVKSVWKEYFDIELTHKQTVFQRLREVCLPRPRDMLMFIGHMIESAVNNAHLKVNEDDFAYAIKEYSEFLYDNLIAEMITEYTNIREILSKLHSKYSDFVELINLEEELNSILPVDASIGNLIDSLMVNGYFKLYNKATGEIYSDYRHAREAQIGSHRYVWKFEILPKVPQIYVIMSPQYLGRNIKRLLDVPKKKRSIFSRVRLLRSDEKRTIDA